VLDASESGSSKLSVKDQSNNDAHGYVISGILYCGALLLSPLQSIPFIYISAWAFDVARSTDRAMPEPRCVGRVTR
jgi:hypothetical protein